MKDKARGNAPTPGSFLPLPSATLHILLSLADGEKHGYAIMQEVDELSDGVVKLGPGTLYSALKRMLTDGLIVESETRPDPDLDDERRRYYRPTALGERVMAAEVQRLRDLIKRSGIRLRTALE